MNSLGNQDSDGLPADYRHKLYRRLVQGALVRSGASLIMWLFALVSFWVGAFQINHFTGISASVAYLVLINPPTLWILKRSTQKFSFQYISVLINMLEVFGYTSIIYFLGGIQATYLIALYCALITYVGIVGTRSLPFVIASFCSICFSLMVVLEHFDFLPSQHLMPSYYCPWKTQLAILSGAIGLLFVTAFIASYTANLLKRNRDKLRKSQSELEKKVEERTAELMGKNDLLAEEIRERIHAEEQNQRSQQFLSSIVENIPNMVFIKNANDLKFIYFNKAGENLLGRSRDEFFGKTASEIFSKEEAEFIDAKDREVLASKQLVDIPEEMLVSKHSGPRILHTKKIPIFDKMGIPQNLLGIAEDITERKLAEGALRKSEERFRELYDSAPVGYHEYDTEGRITNVNRTDLEMLGYSQEEMIGQYIWKFNVGEETWSGETGQWPKW